MKIHFKCLLAFTMTEVMIVMTILGVIATIMITTIKPAEYKEKALETAAKKVMNSIDHATTMILLNDSTDGTMCNLVATNGTKFSICNSAALNKTFADNLGDLYKKYLVATRQTCTDANSACMKQGNSEENNRFYLKDGTCLVISVKEGSGGTIFPGETTTTNSHREARIMFDINCDKEPNATGKDGFAIPLGEKGILWDAPAVE